MPRSALPDLQLTKNEAGGMEFELLRARNILHFTYHALRSFIARSLDFAKFVPASFAAPICVRSQLLRRGLPHGGCRSGTSTGSIAHLNVAVSAFPGSSKDNRPQPISTVEIPRVSVNDPTRGTSQSVARFLGCCRRNPRHRWHRRRDNRRASTCTCSCSQS